MADDPTFEYRLPSLGADMDEGRVIEWRVSVGDTVHRGDLMAVVETEKSDIDIEIWNDGTVEELLAEVGEPIDVGTPIARLRRLGARAESVSTTVPAAPPPAVRPATPPTGAPPRGSPVPGEPPLVLGRVAQDGRRALASPLARRLAGDRGIDLTSIAGTGPRGAVIEADVLRAGMAPSAAPSPVTPPRTSTALTAGERRRSPTSMRAVIAERMSRANREIPHYHLARDVDVSAVMTWLDQRNSERSISERLVPAACYVRAVAVAAARHPDLNGFWVDDHFEPASEVNVAMIVSLRGGGLVAPHIERADERSVDEIMAALGELVGAARTGTLRARWMTGSTITVTNLGDRGADLVHGVISPPQVALVGFGRAVQRPWVVDDLVTIRPVLTTTLAADHRATDGAIGSRFLATIADELELLTSLNLPEAP